MLCNQTHRGVVNTIPTALIPVTRIKKFDLASLPLDCSKRNTLMLDFHLIVRLKPTYRIQRILLTFYGIWRVMGSKPLVVGVDIVVTTPCTWYRQMALNTHGTIE